MQPSPALGIIAKSLPTLQGRVIGVLLGEGFDSALVAKIRKLAESAGASVKLVAEKIAGVDGQLAGTPSLIFDAVAILIGKDDALRANADAQDFARDAFGHLKAIFVDDAGLAFLKANGIAAGTSSFGMKRGTTASRTPATSTATSPISKWATRSSSNR